MDGMRSIRIVFMDNHSLLIKTDLTFNQFIADMKEKNGLIVDQVFYFNHLVHHIELIK